MSDTDTLCKLWSKPMIVFIKKDSQSILNIWRKPARVNTVLAAHPLSTCKSQCTPAMGLLFHVFLRPPAVRCIACFTRTGAMVETAMNTKRCSILLNIIARIDCHVAIALSAHNVRWLLCRFCIDVLPFFPIDKWWFLLQRCSLLEAGGGSVFGTDMVDRFGFKCQAILSQQPAQIDRTWIRCRSVQIYTIGWVLGEYPKFLLRG